MKIISSAADTEIECVGFTLAGARRKFERLEGVNLNDAVVSHPKGFVEFLDVLSRSVHELPGEVRLAVAAMMAAFPSMREAE